MTNKLRFRVTFLTLAIAAGSFTDPIRWLIARFDANQAWVQHSLYEINTGRLP